VREISEKKTRNPEGFNVGMAKMRGLGIGNHRIPRGKIRG